MFSRLYRVLNWIVVFIYARNIVQRGLLLKCLSSIYSKLSYFRSRKILNLPKNLIFEIVEFVTEPNEMYGLIEIE